MNRIILIGNGFDLAHDLNTSYRHFIDNFWKEKAHNLKVKFKYDDDDDLQFKLNFNQGNKNPSNLINNNYNPFKTLDEFTYNGILKCVNNNSLRIKYKNVFLEKITKKCYINWVDIEKEFYCALKECVNDENQLKIDELNNDFKRIKSLLISYLNVISYDYINNMLYKKEILKKILSHFRYKEFSQTYKNILIKNLLEKVHPVFDVDKNDKTYISIIYYLKNILKIENESDIKRKDLEVILNDIPRAPGFIQDLLLKNILFLNFNYTNTSTIYGDKIKSEHSPEIEVNEINIHGTLNDPDNPIIFGYGDEIDEDYIKIENLDDNRYLENIKSTRYHETDNYKKLLEYIDSDYFQLFIFGHSCGLSDRTLLSTLFNHQNCVSIKPFYHRKKDGDDNYSDLVRNISRHFKDKASLRDKVVNKTYCEPLTGSK